MEKENMKNWEEEYWDLWEKEDDLTHISQDILVFIRKLLAEKEKKIIKVYRVYKHYHIFGESGNYEYGVFSSRDKAVERLKEIYEKERKANPEYKFDFKPKEGVLFIYDGFEKRAYYIEEFEVDKKIERRNIGYT